MTPFECYEIYVAIRAHFTTASYDVSKSGFKTRANYNSFLKRRDAAHFYRASKKFKNKRQWVEAVIACHLEDKSYIIDILSSKSDDIISEYRVRIENLPKHYQDDLRTLLDNSTKLDYIFIQNYDNCEPVVIQKLISGEICLESAVIMNSVFRWANKVRTSDTLLWPVVKAKLINYEPLLRYDVYKYRDLTEKVLKSYV